MPDALPVVVLIQSGEFERTDRVRRERIYPEEMRARSHELVMTCRASMLGELVSADRLDGASAVWSMWAGYLDRRSGRRADLRRLGIPLVIHWSRSVGPATKRRERSRENASGRRAHAISSGCTGGGWLSLPSDL